jgi:toxin ParE1/3/4
LAEFRLSRLAEADLMDIAAYTLRTWGESQTLRYLDDLETCCQRLADNPASGRPCDHVRPRLAPYGARQARRVFPARDGRHSRFPHLA